MEKVTISKQFAKAVEFALKDYDADTILEMSINEDPNGWDGPCEALRIVNPVTLARVLYVGYEIEQTPHDLLKEVYDNPADAWNPNAFKAGIERALDILGIEVEGINK